MKHAYLIMAHNEPYILEKLLKLLDDEQNDIYIHVDLKVKDFDFAYYQNLCQKSNVYFTKRTDVSWGKFSQIECELIVIEEAVKKKYDYYHLLSGVDLPLKSNKEINEFFEKNKGYEFVAFAKDKQNNVDRIKYYHYFVKNSSEKFYHIMHYLLIKIQKILKINRLKNTDFTVKKGANWFSITHDLATYVLTKKEFLYQHFQKSLCADELFLQTICYNSKFKKKIYNKYNDEHLDIMRYIDWNRSNGKSPWVFEINDKDILLNSNMLFARKFSTKTKEQKELVDYIFKTINKKNK